jgi:hypothetical protein
MTSVNGVLTRDIIPRMAVQAGLEALLVEMVGNETD